MARSKGVVISVKVPIKWEVMTDRSKQRLRQIVGRDTRVIRSFLGIIEQHENELLAGRNRNKINDGDLDRLTLTALMVKKGHIQRSTVLHDIKSRFPRISTNELQECRLTAIAQYESYLELRRKGKKKVSRPCAINSTRRIPRWVFSQRFSLFNHDTTIANWWLNLRDSMDSVPSGKRVHDRLIIPLRISPFHLNQIEKGEVKALQIFTDWSNKWWISLSIKVDTLEMKENNLPLAVLGIDLGIEKAACTTLVTPAKVRETKYFVQKGKRKTLKKYDKQVANLQHELHIRQISRTSCDKIAIKLRGLRGKRERVSKEYDKVLVKQILHYISKLSEKYTLFIAIGQLKYIRNTARRGNFKGPRFRGMLHSWTFSRITKSLKHGLAKSGWKVAGKGSRFRVVPESWTSIICWKCGARGKRPRQNYFHCPACEHSTNADRNGAINIAARLITLTESLHNVRGLGKWASAIARSTRLKARKKSPSEEKSLLSKKGSASDSGESAAVHHAQSSLLDFSDVVKLGDNDPTVVRTVETLTVDGSDVPKHRQEKEARSVGGMSSQ